MAVLYSAVGVAEFVALISVTSKKVIVKLLIVENLGQDRLLGLLYLKEFLLVAPVR